MDDLGSKGLVCRPSHVFLKLLKLTGMIGNYMSYHTYIPIIVT